MPQRYKNRSNAQFYRKQKTCSSLGAETFLQMSFLTLFSLIKKRTENELLTICLIFKIRHLEVL